MVKITKEVTLIIKYPIFHTAILALGNPVVVLQKLSPEILAAKSRPIVSVKRLSTMEILEASQGLFGIVHRKHFTLHVSAFWCTSSLSRFCNALYAISLQQ